jgi:hypothetical protein
MRYPICENCGIEIRWQPTVVDGHTFCCTGCAQGGPCECDYDNLPRLHEINALVLRTIRGAALQIGQEEQVEQRRRPGGLQSDARPCR